MSRVGDHARELHDDALTWTKLYGNDQCPGGCDMDAQGDPGPHTVDECGGPWARQADLARGDRPDG